jgi:hypothetical protein
MSKTIWTTGPKCECGYGMNQAVILPEQSDIDALRDAYVAAGMDATTALALAKVNTPNSHLVHTPERESEIRRDHLRQATMVLSMHSNEDGSCPGRVGEVPGASNQNEANARAKNFAARLAHAEKVLRRHGGKVLNDEPSMTLAELGAVRA